jgi:hypothetical protein
MPGDYLRVSVAGDRQSACSVCGGGPQDDAGESDSDQVAQRLARRRRYSIH